MIPSDSQTDSLSFNARRALNNGLANFFLKFVSKYSYGTKTPVFLICRNEQYLLRRSFQQEYVLFLLKSFQLKRPTLSRKVQGFEAEGRGVCARTAATQWLNSGLVR